MQTGLNPREEVINTENMFQAGAPSRGRLWGHKPSRVVFETICYVKKSIPIMPNLKILTQKTTEIVFWKVAEAVRKCKDIREYDRLYKKIRGIWEMGELWMHYYCGRRSCDKIALSKRGGRNKSTHKDFGEIQNIALSTSRFSEIFEHSKIA